ncbi:MAG: DUF89 family protein [Caldithrix sp.]|nr:DUF89 family protein [Caldithrix sp.]
MKTDYICIPCMLRQTVETVHLAVEDEETRKKAINAVLNYLQDIPYDLPPPEVGKYIYSIMHEVTGNPDPYKSIKEKYNKAALDLYDDLLKIVLMSRRPLHTAAKLAVAGNVIDFGASSKDVQMRQLISSVHDVSFEIDHFDQFIHDMKQSKQIIYLADNAGEIVFDYLFIEMLKRYYPELHLQITAVVRGAPVINDATIEDARMIGLDKIAKVIDNGDNAPATLLKNASPEMKKYYDDADLIISKGMGNYETLDDEKRLIYYLLKVKCPLISKRINAEIGSMIFKRNSDYHD